MRIKTIDPNNVSAAALTRIKEALESNGIIVDELYVHTNDYNKVFLLLVSEGEEYFVNLFEYIQVEESLIVFNLTEEVREFNLLYK